MGRPRYFRRIFALFLAAALAPAAGISLVYTVFAGSALRREAESRLDSQAAAFARSVASIADSCARDLASVAADPAVLAALETPTRNDPAITSKAFRRILSTFPRTGGTAEASVLSADGSIALILGEAPPDRDMAAYGSWGIFRSLAATPSLTCAVRLSRRPLYPAACKAGLRSCSPQARLCSINRIRPRKACS